MAQTPRRHRQKIPRAPVALTQPPRRPICYSSRASRAAACNSGLGESSRSFNSPFVARIRKKTLLQPKACCMSSGGCASNLCPKSGSSGRLTWPSSASSPRVSIPGGGSSKQNATIGLAWETIFCRTWASNPSSSRKVSFGSPAQTTSRKIFLWISAGGLDGRPARTFSSLPEPGSRSESVIPTRQCFAAAGGWGDIERRIRDPTPAPRHQ